MKPAQPVTSALGTSRLRRAQHRVDPVGPAGELAVERVRDAGEDRRAEVPVERLAAARRSRRAGRRAPPRSRRGRRRGRAPRRRRRSRGRAPARPGTSRRSRRPRARPPTSSWSTWKSPCAGTSGEAGGQLAAESLEQRLDARAQAGQHRRDQLRLARRGGEVALGRCRRERRRSARPAARRPARRPRPPTSAADAGRAARDGPLRRQPQLRRARPANAPVRSGPAVAARSPASAASNWRAAP